MATPEFGNDVVLAAGPDGHVASLVRAAGIVHAHAGVPIAIIGGLAVTCRLFGMQRATQDVDVVSDESPDVIAGAGTAANNLVNAGFATRDNTSAPTRLSIDGTKIEIIETQPITAADVATVESANDRLFVLSHRWAVETATMCAITVIDTPIRVVIPVATPSALVAMKLHAIQDRPNDIKKASDAWDLYRLLDAHNRDGELSRAIAAGPDSLDILVAESLEQFFKHQATRTMNWVINYGEPS